MSHTPLPWSYSEPGEHSMNYELWGSDDENIGSIIPWADHGVDNVKLVDNACNSHEELLAAVGDALDIITWMSGCNDFSEEGQAHKGWVKAREKLTQMFAVYYKAGGKRE